MELNFECVRSLIIYISKNQSLANNGIPNPLHLKRIYDGDEISHYSRDDIHIAAKYLYEKKLIALNTINDTAPAPRSYIIKEITARGFDYIAAIKDDTTWQKIKTKLGTAALASVPTVIQMAATIAAG